MKSNVRFVSPLLGLIAVCSLPLVGCRRIATEALDQAGESFVSVATHGEDEVRVGHLPADFPTKIPLVPNSTVTSAEKISGPNGSYTQWLVLLHTDAAPRNVYAFYDTHFSRCGLDAGPGSEPFTAWFASANPTALLPGSTDATPTGATAKKDSDELAVFDLGDNDGMGLVTQEDAREKGTAYVLAIKLMGKQNLR